MLRVAAVCTVLLLACLTVTALDNGLALTPPMGWLDWERFRCNIDCANDPDNCISEKLFKDMADCMVRDGFKDAGYQYVIIDDCWLAKSRDSQGRLQPDPVRFPSGIPALSDYIHSKGLKFGIYADFGTATCEGYPGSEYFLQTDAQTFADWKVDYFKFDGCYADIHQYDDAFPAMWYWLNKTGRPMVYTNAWPKYQASSGMHPNYKKVAQYTNTWRNFDDVDDSWDSVLSIIEYYGENKDNFADLAGPGGFNDPDMLIVGNYGLSWDQQRVQMAMWSLMAAPLIMSVDLRAIRPESRALLLNRSAIAINQDPLGRQGKRLSKSGGIEVWTKRILPAGSWAFAVLNVGTAVPRRVSVKMSDLGLVDQHGYNVTEVFDGRYMGVFKPADTFTVSVNPTGVFFGKAIIMH